MEWVQTEEKGTAESFEDSAALKSCLKEATLLVPPLPGIFASFSVFIVSEQNKSTRVNSVPWHVDCPFLETTSSLRKKKKKKITADDGLHGSSIWTMSVRKKRKTYVRCSFFIAQ